MKGEQVDIVEGTTQVGPVFLIVLHILLTGGDARDHWFFRIPFPLKLKTIYRYRYRIPVSVSCNVMCFLYFWQHSLGVKFIFTVPVSTERFFSFVLSTTVHFSFFHGPLLKFPNCTSKLGHMSGCQSGIRCTESEFFKKNPQFLNSCVPLNFNIFNILRFLLLWRIYLFCLNFTYFSKDSDLVLFFLKVSDPDAHRYTLFWSLGIFFCVRSFFDLIRIRFLNWALSKSWSCRRKSIFIHLQ